MTDRYLDLHDIARMAGITDASARQYHKRAVENRRNNDPRPGDMPSPDVIVGSRPQAQRPGWARRTVDQWLATRPRKPRMQQE